MFCLGFNLSECNGATFCPTVAAADFGMMSSPHLLVSRTDIEIDELQTFQLVLPKKPRSASSSSRNIAEEIIHFRITLAGFEGGGDNSPGDDSFAVARGL